MRSQCPTGSKDFLVAGVRKPYEVKKVKICVQPQFGYNVDQFKLFQCNRCSTMTWFVAPKKTRSTLRNIRGDVCWSGLDFGTWTPDIFLIFHHHKGRNMFGDTLSSKHYSQAKFKRSRQHASPRSFLVVSCASFCQDGLRLFGRAPVAGNPSRTAGRWVCPESAQVCL